MSDQNQPTAPGADAVAAAQKQAAERDAAARATLAQDPALEAATNELEKCILKFDELQREILPKQQKGIIIPNVEELIYATQKNLAEAIDGVVVAMRNSDNQDAVAVAMTVHTIGVQYFQGVFFGICYTEIMTSYEGDRPFQRLLNRMLQRAQAEGPKTSRLAT
jgi:hypothetical protein